MYRNTQLKDAAKQPFPKTASAVRSTCSSAGTRGGGAAWVGDGGRGGETPKRRDFRQMVEITQLLNGLGWSFQAVLEAKGPPRPPPPAQPKGATAATTTVTSVAPLGLAMEDVERRRPKRHDFGQMVETTQLLDGLRLGWSFQAALEAKGTTAAAAALTSRHQDVGQDGQTGQDEGERLGEAPAHEGHGEHGHQLGRDVHGAEHQLDDVDVEVEVLQVHGQAVVGEARGEPESWVGGTHERHLGGGPTGTPASLPGGRAGGDFPECGAAARFP